MAERTTSANELSLSVAMLRGQTRMLAQRAVETSIDTPSVAAAEASELAEALAIVLADEATLRGMLP